MVGGNKNYGYEACKRCRGTGFGDDGTCDSCYGRGRLLVKQPARQCRACMGTGYLCEIGEGAYHGDCIGCGGSGWQNTIYPMRA